MSYQSMESTIRQVMEKKLTPAEKKKREEIATAIERENPDMPMDQKMAIATAQAKKVAEETEKEPVQWPSQPLDESLAAAKELRSYADKHGGIDKADFHKAADHIEAVHKAGLLQKGHHLEKLNNHIKNMDTDPRDKVHEIIKKHSSVNEEVEDIQELDKQTLGNYIRKAATDAASKAYSSASAAKDNNPEKSGKDFVKSRQRIDGVKLAVKKISKEEVELDEATPNKQQVKQAIGIARDKRYAGGNMTGATKAMDKINKGLAQHPAVAKELQKQNEAVENPDSGGEEEVHMATRQLHFIKYAAEEIMDYIEMVGDLDEWFQNKLTNSFTMIRGLHSYVEGDKRMKGMDLDSLGKEDEDDMEESFDLDAIFEGIELEESTEAYGKTMQKKADDAKKAAMTDSDKQKLGALANLMAKERMKKEEVQLEEEFEQLDEILNLGKGYTAHTEKSRFNGGHRAKIMGPHGKVSYLGAGGYKKPEHAEGEAKAYHDAYHNGPIKNNDRAADRAVHAYRQKHKEHMVENVEEAVGTSAKYADRKGMFGGKYSSHDHAITTKNFGKYRDDRAKKRDDEHKKQDPKMQKMGYAKHMVDTQKAKKKAAERGVEYKTQRSNYHNTNGITPNRKLPEEIEGILNTVINEAQGDNNE